MPIPTSSMYNKPNQIPPRQLARQLWSDFRLSAGKARQGMIARRNMALQDAQREGLAGGRTQQERDQHKAEIAKLHERQHFLEMREEWQRILHSNGLQHEDWGDVTQQEVAAIRQVLGPDELEAEEDDHQGTNGARPYSHSPAGQTAPTNDFAPTPIAAQPLSQSMSHQSQSSYSSYSSASSHLYAAPSLSSRSQNTSSASYAFVDPRQFTDDERDDFPNPLSARKAPAYAVGSEDEDGGIPVPDYKTWARPGQQPNPGYNNWSSSNQSSLSSSPADVASRSFHQPSSSLSSSSHFPPHVPSSLSQSVSAVDDPDRIFTNSSSAAAPSKSKSKIRPGNIGPQVIPNDSENEADGDFASMSRADQNAAYEKFRWEIRVQKIREFHEEAAQIDIEFARQISSPSPGTGGYDKAWAAQIVAQRDQVMLALKARKEEERIQLCRTERTRMKAEIEMGQTNGVAASTTKKGRGAPSNATRGIRTNGLSSSTTTTTSSSAFNAANKTPVVPATNKPKTPATSSSSTAAPGPMNLDGLQNVFDSAPSVGLDTAFQISQLLQVGAENETNYHQTHDQEWGTPQLRHTPNNFSASTSAAAGARQRTDSFSVLDETRFSTISAKGTKQRRGTITVSTAPATNDANNAGGFWKPQAQPPSPEESEALTDKYAKFLLNEGSTTRTSAGKAARRQEDDDDWTGWGSNPTAAHAPRVGGVKTNATSTSAWSAKKPTQTAGSSSPAIGTPSGWGASVKKTFGFGGGHTGGAWGEEEAQENGQSEEFEEVENGEEEEEEEEEVHPSLFGAQKRPSLLSDMMLKGKNVVAGAVGAAMGMPTLPGAPPNGLGKKNGAHVYAAPTPPPPAPPTTANAGAKKGAKKGRQTTNKKGTLTPLMNQDDDAEEAPEMEQSHLTTPRAPTKSTKFTSAFGAAAPNTSKGAFGFGSPPSQNVASSGGVWDDMVSTTPRPSGSLGGFGSSTTSAFGGGKGVRKSSGLHHQVWKAEEEEEEEQEEGEEQEEEQEEEEQEDEIDVEDEWRMPGSLNPRGRGAMGAGVGAGAGAGARAGAGTGAGKFGLGAGTAGAKKNVAKNANTSTSGWGWGPTPPSATNATAKGPKKGSLAHKHHVTMEEIPDDDDGPWNRSPSNVLASDSRVIMEPKPSKPPTMYEGIIQYGSEGASPEELRHNPLAAKKRGNVARGGGNQGEEVFDPEWFQKAAAQLQQGTEQGNRIFGGNVSAGGAKPVLPTNNGVNIPGRANANTMASSGLKSNNPWGTPSLSSSNVTGSISSSFKDASPLANGPPPKTSSAFGSHLNGSKPSQNQAWGPGVSSSPKISVGIGFGKNASAKAKPTTGTSGGIGTASGFGWGTGSSGFGNGMSAGGAFEQESEQYMDGWGEQQDDGEEQEEIEEELLNSRKRLQEMFGDSVGSSAKPSGKAPASGAGGAAAQARMLKEQREREEREREEEERQQREAQEQAEQEAEEKAAKEKAAKEAKEKEAAAAKAAATKAGGAKRGKGKKR